MKTKLFALSCIFSVALFTQPFAQAAGISFASEQMVEIIVKMKDAPSTEDKATLKDISTDTASTDYERALASAMINMEAKVRPEDKPKVLKIWVNPAASEVERNIAKAILRFNSTIDNDNKAVLSQIIPQ